MPDKRLLILAALAVVVAVAFMTVGLRGNIGFALKLRAVRLVTLIQVGVAIAISTVAFQTVTANRVLMPQIMGLDAFYLFGQMALVLALGSVGYVALDPRLKFAGEAGLMMVMVLVLFLPMLRRRFDIGLLLLTGVVLGVLFRSLASLIARLIDPNEFAVVQGSSFADFNTVRPDLVIVGLVATTIAGVIIWRLRHLLDIVALGADSATGLGVSWTKALAGLLLLVSALVSMSTALVGPVTFFGLLVVALVGPNGAGKSSLLSLIARLQPSQRGSISVDGLPVDTTPSRQLARTLAILRQDPAVASRLKVRELVGFGRFPHQRGRINANDLKLIKAALQQCGLMDLADRFLDNLSGGQRQRAMVAMAFCQGTDYMLLDEPLNNLDMLFARQLMRDLRAAADNDKRTVIVVLHDINHAAVYADRIVAMKSGRIVADGSPAEVLARVFGYDMDVINVGGAPLVLHRR